MKVIFMGTPEFSVPCLQRLVQDGHEVLLAVTQPDKPKGRGNRMTPPPVKEFALSRGIEVYQPNTMRSDEVYDTLRGYACDVIVTVAYGKILPQRVLDLPRLGCVNVHASLLPKYRGSAPIQWAVLNGETVSGVTTMFMDAGIDTGDMLEKCEVAISPEMTAGELHDILSEKGAALLSVTLDKLVQGTLTPVQQDDTLSCYAPMLTKALCAMDFSRSAQQLHNQVRGLNPWPTAVCRFGDKLLKVHRAHVGSSTDADCGTVCSLSPFAVACGDGASLVLDEVQYEGGKRMAAADFLRGHPAQLGMSLAEDAANG